LDELCHSPALTSQLFCADQPVARNFPRQPAAPAAIDIALHDAFTQWLGIPLVNFGKKINPCQPPTIGIKDLAATMEEAQEYADRGFSTLKVKLGASLEEDIERIVKLRDKYGSSITIRIDVNQGYTPEQAAQFYQKTLPLHIELIEQPVSAKNIAGMKSLPEGLRKKIAADESLTSPASALRLLDAVPACGIFNIKLMKCGGLQAAGESQYRQGSGHRLDVGMQR
jgi:L-alanine-DL-glutamate epimerase-like enolase superfamily enzyme